VPGRETGNPWVSPLNALSWRVPYRSSAKMTRLIPYSALAAKCITYSKPHLWRLEKAGKFPKRVPIGVGRYGYVEAEIDEWIETRVRERDEALARSVMTSPNGSPV
jgi:prophage regulatory protein